MSSSFRQRRSGALAVPFVSAMVGAAATGAVVWAAMSPPVSVAAARPATSVAAAAPPARHSVQYVVQGGDDGPARVVAVNSAAGQQQAPAVHAVTGASGTVIP